jgi:hypothetical protein
MHIGSLKQVLRISMLGILLVVPAAVAATDNALVGRWELIDASMPMPERCRAFVLQYLPEGILIGSDGSLEETKTYKAQPYKNGYLVEMAYVSSNGKSNCQGLPAEHVKANAIERTYIEVLAADKIRIYFGDRETKAFMDFKKAGPSSRVARRSGRAERDPTIARNDLERVGSR